MLVIVYSQVCWLPFPVQLDSCKLYSSGSLANCLLVNFCPREALAGDWGEEGSKTQVILPTVFLHPWPPALPSVASQQTCAFGSQRSGNIPSCLLGPSSCVWVGRSSLLVLLISASIHQPMWLFSASNTSSSHMNLNSLY